MYINVHLLTADDRDIIVYNYFQKNYIADYSFWFEMQICVADVQK